MPRWRRLLMPSGRTKESTGECGFFFSPGTFAAVGFGAQEILGGPPRGLRALGEFEEFVADRSFRGFFSLLCGGGEQSRFARFLDEFFGAKQRGQMARNAVEGGGAFVAGAVFLGALDLFPLRPDGIDGFGLGI